MTTITAPGMTIPDVVSGYAHRQPDQEAVVCGDQRLTWGAFVAAYHRAANALIDRGLKKGDKVGLLMRSSAEMAVLIMAVSKAGGVVVPLSPLSDPQAITRMIQRADASYLFATEDNLAKLDAIISFSSVNFDCPKPVRAIASWPTAAINSGSK